MQSMPLFLISSEPLHNLSSKKIQFWVDDFAKNVPMYFMNFQGCQAEENVLKLMETGVKELGLQHIIIDNIQFMLGERGNVYQDRFLRQDRFVGALRSFSTESKAHLSLVVHPRKEEAGAMLSINSLYGGGKISQEADNIMLIQESDGVIPKKFVQVVKNRFDGSLGKVNLKFNRERRSFRPFNLTNELLKDEEIMEMDTKQ